MATVRRASLIGKETKVETMKRLIQTNEFLGIILIPVFGYLLSFTALMISWVFSGFYNYFMDSLDLDTNYATSGMKFILIVFFIAISWKVYASRLNDFIKSIYSVLPVMVIFMNFMDKKWLPNSYIINGLIFTGILIYLYWKKKPWYYYYSITLTLMYLIFIIYT